MADAASHFGRDDRGARANERIIHSLSGTAVVQNGTTHAIDWLLGAVPRVGFAVLDRPDCRLLAVTRPVAGCAFADRIPAGLVLPVVMSAANDRALLVPDNLGTQLKTDRFE